MARARNIKPGLFENEILGQADPLLTILFVSLWCLADREGRLEDRPEKIRKFAFGYRDEKDINVERSLNELQRSGFIIRYEVDETKIIQVKKFKEHQTPHMHEKKSVLPPCDDKSLIRKDADKCTVQAPHINGASTIVKRSDSLIPDTGYLIPDNRYPIPNTKAKTRQKLPDMDFEKFWQLFPKREGANKTQTFRVWQKNLNNGVSQDEMLRGADRYRLYCIAENKEPKFILAGSTFLGPDLHYTLPWIANGNSKADMFDKWLTGSGGGQNDIIDI